MRRKSRAIPIWQFLKAEDKPRQRVETSAKTLTYRKGTFFFCVCFSHVQWDAHLRALGDWTPCRWEETIFKLPVCKPAPKWQRCHCCFCSKHPIKLAVYTFLPDSCLPAQKGWAANEAQHGSDRQGGKSLRNCRLSPVPWQSRGRPCQGGDPGWKEGHTWAKPSPGSFSRRLK